jgi:hypothetical protein
MGRTPRGEQLLAMPHRLGNISAVIVEQRCVGECGRPTVRKSRCSNQLGAIRIWNLAVAIRWMMAGWEHPQGWGGLTLQIAVRTKIC